MRRSSHQAVQRYSGTAIRHGLWLVARTVAARTSGRLEKIGQSRAPITNEWLRVGAGDYRDAMANAQIAHGMGT